ncbi:MAG: DUF4231 domain-containing protein [Anaerolineae bacterium]
MNAIQPFAMNLSETRTATAVRTGIETDPAAVAAAFNLRPPARVLLLSAGAGLMSEGAMARLEALFKALADMLAREGITVIDGGTRFGGIALMGQSLAQAEPAAPYIGVLPARAEVEPGGPRGEAVLEPNHSHVVLLEHDEWGGEIGMMSGLAGYLSGGGRSVTLLVNGGGVALKDVQESVRVGREVIVIAGSGRLADEIARAVRQPNSSARPPVAALARSGCITLFDLAEPPETLIDLLLKQLDTRRTAMAANTPSRNLVLEDAWQRFAHYDYSAEMAQRSFFRLRKWILGLGVAATTLALVYATLKPVAAAAGFNAVLRYIVILIPISISVLQAFSSKFKGGTNYIILRSRAETLKKEIFRYRAGVAIYSPERTKTRSKDAKLATKAKLIGSQLMETEVNQASLKLYRGELPPQQAVFADDDGFSELTPEKYLKWRLEHQYEFYRAKAEQLNRRMRRLEGSIYLLGGLGTFLAAIGLEIWIAVTTALAAAVISYLEIRRVEATLISYNQAATDLESIRIWWHAVELAGKTKENFDKLVRNTEGVLQSEHAGWEQEMRNALVELDQEELVIEETE